MNGPTDGTPCDKGGPEAPVNDAGDPEEESLRLQREFIATTGLPEPRPEGGLDAWRRAIAG